MEPSPPTAKSLSCHWSNTALLFSVSFSKPFIKCTAFTSDCHFCSVTHSLISFAVAPVPSQLDSWCWLESCASLHGKPEACPLAAGACLPHWGPGLARPLPLLPLPAMKLLLSTRKREDSVFWAIEGAQRPPFAARLHSVPAPLRTGSSRRNLTDVKNVAKCFVLFYFLNITILLLENNHIGVKNVWFCDFTSV